MKEKDKNHSELTALALFALSSCIFFASSSGIYSSNDGAHLALVKAIYHDHSYVIDNYFKYTGGIDYAEFEGHKYSDRAPGMAYATVPFYALGNIVSEFITFPTYHRGWDGGEPHMFFTLLISVFSAAATVVLVYMTSRLVGAGEHASIVAALSIAFGTILWKYSVKLYSHSLSAFLGALAFYLCIRLKDAKKQGRELTLLFFVIGYLPLVEYPNVLLSAVFFAYLVFSNKVPAQNLISLKKYVRLPLALMALGLVMIPVYDMVNFGNALTPAYEYSPHHAWVADMSESAPLTEGVAGLLFSYKLAGAVKGAQGGIFFMGPVLLFGLVGWFTLLKNRKTDAFLTFSLFLSHLLFYGRFKTWWGGGDFDTRYLLTVTPLLGIGIALYVEKKQMRLRNEFLKTVAEAGFWFLFSVSVLNVAWDVSEIEGPLRTYFTFPALLPSEISSMIWAVFPSLHRLGAFVGLLLIAYCMASVYMKRLPGFGVKLSKGDFEKAAYGGAALGFILVVLFSQKGDGYYSVSDLRYTSDGVEWRTLEPPYSLDQDTLYVKGTVYVRGTPKIPLTVAAQDCIRRIHVNDRVVADMTSKPCTPCLHCKGVPIDLSGLGEGENTLSFMIKSVSNSTRFMIK